MENQFHEKQRFNQWWIWLLISGLLLTSYYTCIQEVVYGQSVDSDGPSGTAAFLPPVIMTIILLLFLLLRLETRIDQEGVHVRFFPIHRTWRTYPWTHIAHVEVRAYRPLLEYGGWGLRGIGSNRALNVAGKIGIQLVFASGDKLLIGTQRGGEAKIVIAKYRNHA